MRKLYELKRIETDIENIRDEVTEVSERIEEVEEQLLIAQQLLEESNRSKEDNAALYAFIKALETHKKGLLGIGERSLKEIREVSDEIGDMVADNEKLHKQIDETRRALGSAEADEYGLAQIEYDIVQERLQLEDMKDDIDEVMGIGESFDGVSTLTRIHVNDMNKRFKR